MHHSIAVFAQSGWSNMEYLFKITNDILTVSSGKGFDSNARSSFNLKEIQFSKPIEIKSVKLSESQCRELKNYLDKIGSGTNEMTTNDAWNIYMQIDDKQYEFTYGSSQINASDNILKAMINYSPIKVLLPD